ncbi:hypothetical protein Cva_00132 [Caedimonas varicaedens]|uniref:Ribbon-helix-helix protein CopG domain-containing protein n=1 Tax=Caedimonas varicaedens TaxID=1629334 RepID=A0A0K8MAH7_9PROT|nr:hypothetical protein Cva_00132 [Caedimonas varicaedens]
MLTINVSEKLESRFHELAKEIGEDETSLIKKAFFELMEDMEDTRDGLEALKEMEISGEKKTYSMEEVEQELRETHVEH